MFPNLGYVQVQGHEASKLLAPLQETFTRYNAWTEADNFLLVEKLVSQTSEEAWREVAESVDNSATYALESYRAKACRKYAVVHGISYEAVDMEKVEKSSHGIQGWADMNVVVPGINEGARHSANPVMPIEGAPQDELDPPGPKAKAKGKAKAKPNSKRGGGKAKKEGPDTKDLEKEARESLMKAQRSQSLMENVCGTGADIPSEYAWTKSFLEEYAGLAKNFKDALQPDDGEDLLAFVNELKLAALSPAAMKTIKKTWGDKYHNMLTLFNDRCGRICFQPSACRRSLTSVFATCECSRFCGKHISLARVCNVSVRCGNIVVFCTARKIFVFTHPYICSLCISNPPPPHLAQDGRSCHPGQQHDERHEHGQLCTRFETREESLDSRVGSRGNCSD